MCNLALHACCGGLRPPPGLEAGATLGGRGYGYASLRARAASTSGATHFQSPRIAIRPMRPTRPPDDRRARHEAAGEWPQPNVSAMLDARRRSDAGRVFMIEGVRSGGRQFTYGQLATRADRMTVALRRLGVRAADVVSWQLPNWFEGAALTAAIDRIGAIANPIISIYREREVGFVCRQARAKVLIVPGIVRGFDHRELAETVRAQAPDLEHVLTVRAEPAAGQT